MATTNRRDTEKINQFITASEVRVVHDEKGPLGVMTTQAALELARAEGVDLVEIASNASPPVCKLIDYGKYRYELQKKNKEAKKRQKIVHLKEIKMRPQISIHDYSFKMKHVREFLSFGDKVKVTIMFRGREMTHTEFGRDLANRIIADLSEEATVEKLPKLEGRNLTTVLNPIKVIKPDSDDELQE